MGGTPSLASFGAEYEKWLKALGDSCSPESKISEKLNRCSKNLSRSGHLTQ